MKVGVVREEVKVELWQNWYKSFIRLYRGRNDVIAEQKENGEYISIEGEGLTSERFLDHIHLRKTYAIYNRDDLKRVHFGLFDVDVLPRNQEWKYLLSGIEEKRKETRQIMKTLMETGLKRQQMLLEFPTVGFHLLIFFKDPVETKRATVLMRRILKRSHLTHIPFYPKEIAESPWGDRVQLPLRINRNTSKRSNFIRDLETFDSEHYDPNPDFSVLEEVASVPSEWVERWSRDNTN